MTTEHNKEASPAVLWLSRDLRVDDNPALAAAAAGGRAVVPVFVLDETAGGEWAIGGASRWWLHQSLVSLAHAFAQRGSYLILRRGDPAIILPELAARVGARQVHVAAPCEPWRRQQVAAVDQVLRVAGVTLHRHRSVLLFDPDKVRTKTGGPYGVFTPFSRACEAIGVSDPPHPAPTRIASPPPVAGDELADWRLLPTKPDWAGGLRETWRPGEAGAAQRLDDFLRTALSAYDEARNIPGGMTTSMLSPHLHWGEISPRRVWLASQAAAAGESRGGKIFRTELLWREFSAHLLWHHPTLPERPLRPEFAAMPWRDDPPGLRAWQLGQTGIPLVDAGMRQLWQTGWQHNRVRMVTASFVIKHLLLDWRLGEAWFWDTLVDADLASNAASWQWVAGCGADAAPFFRVFNPVLQSQKFDPAGRYIRRYVPELARLPDRYVHAPWEAPELELRAAGVTLGRDYPRPIVDLAAGREQALAAFNALPRNAA